MVSIPKLHRDSDIIASALARILAIPYDRMKRGVDLIVEQPMIALDEAMTERLSPKSKPAAWEEHIMKYEAWLQDVRNNGAIGDWLEQQPEQEQIVEETLPGLRRFGYRKNSLDEHTREENFRTCGMLWNTLMCNVRNLQEEDIDHIRSLDALVRRFDGDAPKMRREFRYHLRTAMYHSLQDSDMNVKEETMEGFVSFKQGNIGPVYVYCREDTEAVIKMFEETYDGYVRVSHGKKAKAVFSKMPETTTPWETVSTVAASMKGFQEREISVYEIVNSTPDPEGMLAILQESPELVERYHELRMRVHAPVFAKFIKETDEPTAILNNIENRDNRLHAINFYEELSLPYVTYLLQREEATGKIATAYAKEEYPRDLLEQVVEENIEMAKLICEQKVPIQIVEQGYEAVQEYLNPTPVSASPQGRRKRGKHSRRERKENQNAPERQESLAPKYQRCVLLGSFSPKRKKRIRESCEQAGIQLVIFDYETVRRRTDHSFGDGDYVLQCLGENSHHSPANGLKNVVHSAGGHYETRTLSNPERLMTIITNNVRPTTSTYSSN